MRALDLDELSKRWRLWRELEHLQHGLGLSPFGDASNDDPATDDARSEALPDDLIVPRPPRLD